MFKCVSGSLYHFVKGMWETGVSVLQVAGQNLGGIPVPWWDARWEKGPLTHRIVHSYLHIASVVTMANFIDKFTSVKLKSTLIQKVKCFDEIPCLVIPVSALVKVGESEMEMQSISLNGGRKLALKTETKPQPQFYLFT